jgi:hypothetical protein
VDDAGLGTDLEREAALREHVEHPVVGRQDVRLEGLEAVRCGRRGNLGEHRGPEPLALELIGDGEGDLDRVRLAAHVHRVADDSAAAQSDESEAVAIVDPDSGARRDHRPRTRAEEAERTRAEGEPREEVGQRALVIGRDRAQVDGRAVPQRDLRLMLCRIARCGWASADVYGRAHT